MYTSLESRDQSTNDIEATWLRQRSDNELRSFIEQRHDSIADDVDLILDGLF